MKSNHEESEARFAEALARTAGPGIKALFDNLAVTEIGANSDGTLWVAIAGTGLKVTGEVPLQWAEQVIALLSAHYKTDVTPERPFLECRWPGTPHRVHGVVKPIVDNPSLTIRKHAPQVFPLSSWLYADAVFPERIMNAVKTRQNILVAGGTDSGKTSLLNALLGLVVQYEPTGRVLILEDTPELQCKGQNVEFMQTSDEVALRRQVRAAMRMRPDRIIIGEVRGAEALDLLKANNTGHKGSITTVHANSGAEVEARLEQLVLEAGVPWQRSLYTSAIDVVVYMEKLEEGRIIKTVSEVN